MAEREGFEPSLGLTLNTLSRRAPSAVISSRVMALPIQLKATLCSGYNDKGQLFIEVRLHVQFIIVHDRGTQQA